MIKKFLILFFILGFVSSAQAASIIKVGLSETAPDLIFDGTTFHTINDGNAATLGDQNTNVNFVGFLVGVQPDITTAVASFTLSGVSLVGGPNVVGALVSQATTGGSFSLYDAANTLLLSGNLADGAISGSNVATTGSFFNTTFGTFTGGTLLPLLVQNSLGISFALGGIDSSGVAHLVTGPGGLNAFTANGTGLIDATPVPEPLTGALLLSGIGAMGVRRRMSKKA